ncbi:hypothetical protein IAU60_002331 [Kwoniella sp. DSM 27419]
MSLLAPRFVEAERASVLLPTVTCSSCAAPIPLSSLGEHVCAGPSRGMASRSAPRPSQITIPPLRPAMPRQGSAHDAPRQPFANSSGSLSSPNDLAIPRNPSATSLSPHDAAFGTQGGAPLRTPSPTNPFFPHSGQAQAGPSSSAPALSSSAPGSAPLIDTTSGGESGMAGVGRRAFAAAAWGVRAGVALAAAGRHHTEPILPNVGAQHPTGHTRPQPTPREPVMLPKAPLSGRQRTGPSSSLTNRPEMYHSHSAPVEFPSGPSSSRSRSPASSEERAPQSSLQLSSNSLPKRKESVSSTGSSHHGERTRTATAPAPNNSQGFFDKVKQLHARSNTASPSFGGANMARSASEGSGSTKSNQLVSSPQTTTFDLELEDDYDDQRSALPWATPALDESPVISQGPIGRSVQPTHHRYPTAGSEASSSSSSSRSGRWGTHSGPDSEEVVTPSQSLEMLSERISLSDQAGARNDNEPGVRGYGGVMEGRDLLDQIGEEDEEDEGERVVFGTPTARDWKGEYDSKLPNSNSTSTITSNSRFYLPTVAPNSSPARPKASNLKDTKHGHKPSTSSSTDSRRKKVCAKCGDGVGGSKRFVERDGVVLCEKDWKKLYLPSCRRCALPIEKSAVSSSDGQLKGKWHRACFTCSECDKPFEGDDFYVHGGKPWCQYHYHEQNGTLCASSSCRQPIEGACVVTPGPDPQRYHPGHLRCDHRGSVSGAQSCRESMDEYYELGGRNFCERHVGEASRRVEGAGRNLRAEKRRTRLVDLPSGAF